MSRIEIVESIETMKEGDERVVNLQCGSVLKVRHVGNGFRVVVIDSARFVHADWIGDYNGRTVEQMQEEKVYSCDGLTGNRLYLYIDITAISTLRALLCGMQRNAR